MISSVLSLGTILIAAVTAVPSADTPAYDVFANVLSEPQRSVIERDSRCADVHVQVNTYVASHGSDMRAGIESLRALEICNDMRRLGDWSEYRDYLMTAAAAIAYQVGVNAKEPKAFVRALRYLALVSGFESPNSLSIQSTTRVTAVPFGADAGLQEMAGMGAPPQANINNRTETRHSTGYSGPYGELASRIGAAAQRALAESKPTPR